MRTRDPKVSRYSLPFLVGLLAVLAMLGISNPSIARAADSMPIGALSDFTASNNGLTVTFSGSPTGNIASASGSWTDPNQSVQWLCGQTPIVSDTPNPYGQFAQSFTNDSRTASQYGNQQCGVSGGFVWTSVRIYNATTNTVIASVDSTPPGPSGTTACASGTFSDLKASYVNNNLWVSWRWIGGDSDSLSYPMFWLGNNSETVTYVSGAVYTAPAGVIASHASDGYYMFGKTPVAASFPGASVHLYFQKNSSTFICEQQIIPDGSKQITPGPTSNVPSDYGDSNDPDSGSKCSGFDIFCRIKAAIKWAFVPSQATQTGWTNQINGLENNPPISTVSQAYNLTHDVYDAYSNGSSVTSGARTGSCGTGGTSSFYIDSTGNCVVSLPLYDANHNTVTVLPILHGAGDQMQNTFVGQCIYWTLTAFMTCCFGMYWFKTVTGSVGNHGD